MAADTEPENDLMAPFARDYTAEVDDVNDGERKWVVSRITTASLDSFGTVVDPNGMDRSEYERNKVVLWEHGKDAVRGRVPIGRCSWIKPRRDKGDVIAKTVFADDDFSRGVFGLYRDGALKGWSVYGLPVQVSPPTKEEIARRPELERCKAIYRRWVLKEYSGVAIPGNLDAVTEACSRGAWVPDVVRAAAEAVGTAGGYATCPECKARGVSRDGDHEVCPSGHRYKPVAKGPPDDGGSVGVTGSDLPPLRGRSYDDVQSALDRRIKALVPGMLRDAIEEARDLARGRV